MIDQVPVVQVPSKQRHPEPLRDVEHRRQRERVARSLLIGAHSLREVYPQRKS